MLILTAFAIGLVTAGLRSAVCYVLAGALILVAFAAAAIVSPGGVSLIALVFAVLAYNGGIAAPVFAAFMLLTRRQA